MYKRQPPVTKTVNEPTTEAGIAEIKDMLTTLVEQVAAVTTEVKQDVSLVQCELALLSQRVSRVEKKQNKNKKQEISSESSDNDSTTDQEEEEDSGAIVVANVNKGTKSKETEKNPYYKRGPEWKAAYNAMNDKPYKGILRFPDYESLLQKSGQYKTIPVATDTQDVLANLQMIREKFTSLRISPDSKTFINVVLDKVPATLRKNLSLARSRGIIRTEEQLCAKLKQLIVGGSSYPAEKIKARQTLLERFPQQDRALLDPNEVALYAMGDLSERILVTKRDYPTLSEGEKDLLRKTIAKELFTHYIEQRAPDAQEFIERNMYGEEDILNIAARISAYLKNPLSLAPTNLGTLVGNVEKQDAISAAEQIKRTQETMDRKVAELMKEKEKLMVQNNKLRKEAQNSQGAGGQQPERRQQPFRRRRPEDHRPCRYCVANNRNGLQCHNLKFETNGLHCFTCSTASRMEIWPCPPCQERIQRRREERRQRPDGGQQQTPASHPGGGQ